MSKTTSAELSCGNAELFFDRSKAEFTEGLLNLSLANDNGITYEDVTSAANTLKAQGKSVTIENVRGFLGTGSSGTVNQHLRRWKEAQNSTQKIASKENLPQGLITLIKGLWEGVLAQSTEQFTPIETNYQQEISELKAELEKYRSNNQRWQKLFNQWQQEKIALVNEKLTLEQALEFAHKEKQSLHGKYDALLGPAWKNPHICRVNIKQRCVPRYT